jgi:hypothetical protein
MKTICKTMMFLVLVMALVSCNAFAVKPTQTAVPTATDLPIFIKEFRPKNDSLFKIMFSYPSNWVWEKDIPFDELPPGEEPPPSERMVIQDGGISIQVYKPSNPQAQMMEWMDSYLGAVTNMPHTDITIGIDGYEARWLTVVYPPLSTTSESYTQEVIYLLTEDRFYSIDFTYFESEKDGRLYKEFKELIKTIKILQ